jgi:ubiquinone/menaquinone biosynthesis C-methylase UbiE
MSEALDFSQRAQVEEEMDGPCSYEELRRCLRHLAIVNRLTLAHRHTLRWLDQVLRTPRLNPSRKYRLVDIGCGYGDMLRLIEQWAEKRGIQMELIGVDINPNAIRAAREATPECSRIRWVLGEASASPETQGVDLVTSCGVFHHLSEAEIVRLLEWMERTATVGWYITDLHRKPVPYRVFDLLMRGPWWHRFIRTDGLRSIRRSFLAEDWQRLCGQARIDITEIRMEECRPARLCVGRVKQETIDDSARATARL